MKIIFCISFFFSSLLIGMENNANERFLFINIMPLNLYIGNNERGALRLVSHSIRNAIINANHTIPNHQLMSKKDIESDENIFYITQNSFGNIAYIQKICKECLQPRELCFHQKSFNDSNYPGILGRTHKDEFGLICTYKAYISHTAIEELAKAYECVQKYTHIINTQKNNIHIPKITETKPYTYSSKPYFNYQNNAYILENIPSKSIYGWKGNIYECELSDKNICTQRKVYFTFLNKLYLFARLSGTPYLLTNFIKQIENGKCRVKRYKDKTIFCSPDFFKEYLPDEKMLPFLSEIFEHTSKGKTLEDTLIFKLTGNIDEAENCLKRYNTSSFFSRSYLNETPVIYRSELEGIYEENQERYIPLREPKYQKILEGITTLQDADQKNLCNKLGAVLDVNEFML